MYVLALSDTHLPNGSIPEQVKKLADNAAWIFHAGDFNSKKAYEELKAVYKDKLVAVKGNSDDAALSILPSETSKTVGGIKIGLVHKVSECSDAFAECAAQQIATNMDVDVLIFGHIHQPIIAWGEKLLICPGRCNNSSATQKRCNIQSVALIDINGNRVTSVNIKPIL